MHRDTLEPKLEINTNKTPEKRPADNQTDGQMAYYNATQGISTRGLRPHALHAITCRANDCQKVMQATRQKYRETEIRMDT